jgi:hypothetical protein
MTRIVKTIDRLSIPTEDMERVGKRWVGIVNQVMVNVIDVRIGVETAAEVPIGETGNLAGSWTGALGPEFEGTKIIFRFGYGTNYAVYVHEIPEPPDKSIGGRSARHRPPTKWKFLEDPHNRHQGDILPLLQIEIDRIHLEVGT